MTDLNVLIVQQNVNPNDPNGSQRRYAMLTRHRELAEHAISQAPSKDTVIIIWDLSECPKQFTEQKEWILQCEQNDSIPSIVMQFPRWNAYKALKRYQLGLHKIDARDPKLSPIVERLTQPAMPGHFYTLVISRGKQLVEWNMI